MSRCYDDISMYDEHPSIENSLEDFEIESSPELERNHSPRRRSVLRELSGNRMSNSRSTFQSEDSADDGESEASGPWSPPAWRSGGLGYYEQTARNRLTYSTSKSPAKSTAFRYGSTSEEMATLAANVPLPASASPEKRSMSPTKHFTPRGATPALQMQERISSPFQAVIAHTPDDEIRAFSVPPPAHAAPAEDVPPATNYIRFNINAEYQHPHDSLNNFFECLLLLSKTHLNGTFSIMRTIGIATMAYTISAFLFGRSVPMPTPDISKLSSLVRSYEPMIFYAETGQFQIMEMSQTSIAVWDLGETVRGANLTSGMMISNNLDELGNHLQTLALEMTRFFANVDGDLDSTLITMEFAKRRLEILPDLPQGSVAAALDNLHGFLHDIGLMEWKGKPNFLGKTIMSLFGQTINQKNAMTLRSAFYDILNSLEEAIQTQTETALLLFGVFENIDRKFNSLHKLVVREYDQQEQDEVEMLSSLWAKVVGANQHALRKFQQNKDLLGKVRSKTIQNKHMLMAHNQELLSLRESLGILRKKLFSPLVHRNETDPLSMNDQISSLDDTLKYLRVTRDRHKSKSRDLLLAASARKLEIIRGEKHTAIDPPQYAYESGR